MKRHSKDIYLVIQPQDGRLCSCSCDRTIKLWGIDRGLCELTLNHYLFSVVLYSCLMEMYALTVGIGL